MGDPNSILGETHNFMGVPFFPEERPQPKVPPLIIDSRLSVATLQSAAL